MSNDAREPLPRRRNGPASPRANQADSWINAERGSNRAPHLAHQGPMPWITSLLPQLEFSKYDGDPRRWSEFIGSFKSLVHDVIPTNAQRMGILRQMISPEIRKSLGNILNDPNLYDQALYQLKKRYGDPYKISRAHLQSLHDIKPCCQDDLDSLRSFWLQLKESVTTLQAGGDETDLICSSNVERVAEKLPRNLTRQWGKCVYRMRPARPTLIYLEEFLETAVESEECIQPFYHRVRRKMLLLSVTKQTERRQS